MDDLAGRRLHDDRVPIADFVTWSEWALARVGFRPTNALALVGVCRDELMHDFESAIAGTWGEPFEIGSLAGLVFIGQTGVRAALGHVPGEDGRHRLAAFCFPHIGIDDRGRIGRVRRRGRVRSTAACGALVAYRADLEAGIPAGGVDPDDVEQSLLRRRLRAVVSPGEVPSLVAITELARGCAVADLRRYVELARSGEPVDVAYVSGILVHEADGTDTVAGVHAEVVIDGAVTRLAH